MNMDKALVNAFLQLMEFDDLRTFLRTEIQQRGEEGSDVAALLASFAQAGTRSELVDLYERLLSAPVRAGYAFIEPDTLPEIRRLRTQEAPAPRLNPSPEVLYDRIHGGWLGRVAGCVLGKPVEPWGLKETIAKYLSLANSYPLSNYFPRLDPFPVDFIQNQDARSAFLSEISGAPEDDDTDYTILALHILERYGLSFSTADVANEWLGRLPYHRTWTAERATYRNLVLGVPAAEAALLVNPEREYIGARIRADLYGFISPGQPEQAAELAYRDAVLSHTRNGIYSAMFTAACISWAFAVDDIDTIIRGGLAQIPANCRLAQAIREVLELRSQLNDWESAYAQLRNQLTAYHPAHAINNTVLVVLALLYGDGDLEKTICTAVMCGFDTDCNGANAGSVIGVLLGAQKLPGKWTAPIQDTLYSSVTGFAESRISELAQRTTQIAKNALPIFSERR
jgi:ADP-ribosylglycohydrolase